MLSSDNIGQNADITTTADAKTIDIEAADAVTMMDGTTIESNNGDIRIKGTGGDVTVDTVTVDGLGTGNVAVIAGADITDIDGDSLITADGLSLTAGSGIGAGSNVLNTSVDTLSASAGSDGMFVTEANGVTIDSVTTTVQRVDATGLDDNLTDTAHTQEDLTATVDGAIVLDGQRR